MQLLQQLLVQSLPVEVHGDDVEKVIVLMDAMLISATIPAPEGLALGLNRYRATVSAITPTGRRVAQATRWQIVPSILPAKLTKGTA
jgi:hypothetical protein